MGCTGGVGEETTVAELLALGPWREEQVDMEKNEHDLRCNHRQSGTINKRQSLPDSLYFIKENA